MKRVIELAWFLALQIACKMRRLFAPEMISPFEVTANLGNKQGS